jgi:hypothetical protein
MKLDLYLVVQEGCTPCVYVKRQLERVENWEKYVKIVDAREDLEFVKRFQLTGTPSLVGVKQSGEAKVFSGAKEMTKSFWVKLFESLDKGHLVE